MHNIIIAIDGFSSTGKSSFAKLIAARLGIQKGTALPAAFRQLRRYAVEPAEKGLLPG